MGWGLPFDVSDLVARTQKRGQAFVDALSLDSLEREDEKLSAIAWEVGRGWFPTLPDRATLHSGLDIGLPDGGGDTFLGAPVLSIGDGDVVYADTILACSAEGYDFGRVIVRHPTPQGDAYALYMQLGTVETFVGAQLKQGDLIGSVGWHGNFHHLHFAVASKQPLGGGSDLIPEVPSGQWPDGDGLWNVLRVKVDDLDPNEWPEMPDGPWYLINPIEFVRCMRGDEYRHYTGCGSPHTFVADPKSVSSEAQAGKDNVHKADELLQFDSLKSNDRLMKLAHGEGDPVAKGDKDKDTIVAIQKALQACEYSMGRGGPAHDGVDGDYGKTTERVVKRFQTEIVKVEMADLLAHWGKTADDIATDGKLDRFTLLALDARASAKTGAASASSGGAAPAAASGGDAPAADAPAASDAPAQKPPDPVISVDNAPWIFDAVNKKQSLKFGLRLYRALLRWELTDWADKTGRAHQLRDNGCLYSGDADGSFKPYREKYDEFFKDKDPRWKGSKKNTMMWTEWPDLDLCKDLFGEIPSDDTITLGGKDYKVYVVGGATWVGSHRCNCCNTQFAAFTVATGGQQVSVRTSDGDQVYWMRPKDKKHNFSPKALAFECAMMCNFANPDDFWHHGGGLEGMKVLGIGAEVGDEGGKYTIKQETLMKVRIGDWANTPGHAWLVGDIRYGIWTKEIKKDSQKPDVYIGQSSFAVAETPADVVRLTDAQVKWISDNEDEFMRRVQKFIDSTAASGAQWNGKPIVKFEVVDVCEFTANGFATTVHGVRWRQKKGSKDYEEHPDNPPQYHGITRKWSDVPNSSTSSKDGSKTAGPGASYARFYGPAK